MLGAISQDHLHLSMDRQDQQRYSGMARWKENKERQQRNLDA